MLKYKDNRFCTFLKTCPSFCHTLNVSHCIHKKSNLCIIELCQSLHDMTGKEIDVYNLSNILSGLFHFQMLRGDWIHFINAYLGVHKKLKGSIKGGGGNLEQLMTYEKLKDGIRRYKKI